MPSSLKADESRDTPLCVDLDGTLIWIDTLHESALRLLRVDPVAFISALVTLLFHGIAAFKRAVASRVALRPELLPYNEQLVAYLSEQSAEGRRILLVTAADRLIAEQVASHLGIFEGVLASDASTNLKSDEKVREISRYLNGECFEYAGNSSSDIPVWKAASAAVLVNPTPSIRQAVTRSGVRITKEIQHRAKSKLLSMVRAMRVYQWTKNLLIFLPLLLSHRIFDIRLLKLAANSFWILSLTASAVYVINDLLDLDSDRRHPFKCRRPFAAGALTVKDGVALAAILLVISGAASLLLLPLAPRLLVLAYLTTSLLYSVRLKTCVFLDIITLAGLYTLRVLFGGLVTGIVISPWTLAFAIFFFGFLATCKRLSELRSNGLKDTDLSLPGRAYSPADLVTLTSLACSSGYVAVLILALYMNSPEVVPLYKHPKSMWLLVPVLTYWIGRTVMVANRGDMHDDPIVYAFRDRSSLVTGLLALAAILKSL